MNNFISRTSMALLLATCAFSFAVAQSDTDNECAAKANVELMANASETLIFVNEGTCPANVTETATKMAAMLRDASNNAPIVGAPANIEANMINTAPATRAQNTAPAVTISGSIYAASTANLNGAPRKILNNANSNGSSNSVADAAGVFIGD